MTVYDQNQRILTNIDFLNSSVSLEGTFDVAYSNQTVLTADIDAINAYVPMNVNGVFTHNSNTASLVNIPH